MVAAKAEEKKKMKYSNLDSCYSFTPIAIETSGVIGMECMLFMGVGHRLQQVSEANMGFLYFFQWLSVTMQRGNAVSVVGTTAGDDGHEVLE